jgi:heme-degrading monooxygenase HmoA
MTDHAPDTFAATPEPPYIAVIFTSTRTPGDEGYAAMADAMEDLAARQPGYLGVESAHEALGITVSYWQTPDDARAWKLVAEHLAAQQLGRDQWYQAYRVRVATVERDYGFDRGDTGLSDAGELPEESQRPETD